MWRRIDEIAGQLGIDPEPLTLRRLAWRYEAWWQAEEARWRVAATNNAELLAMLANCHKMGWDQYVPTKNGGTRRIPGRHNRPWTANEFLPRRWQVKKKRPRVTEDCGIEVLKVFLPEDDPNRGVRRET